MPVTAQDWLQAQYSVLGSALIEPQLVPKILAATERQDFSGECQTVYDAMRTLFASGKPADAVTLADSLGKQYRNFLAELMQVTPSAANIDYYITACREQSRVLSLREIGQTLADAGNMSDARQAVETANKLMVNKQSARITTMQDALKSFYERHTKEKTYLPWPVRELEDRLYAEPGDFIIVGGAPSAGKSAWALQCAWCWAKRKRVGFYSLETTDDKLFDRQISSVVGISMDNLKRNTIQEEDWNKLTSMADHILSRNLELVPAAGFSASDVFAMAMMRRHEIVIVDYLQLLQSTGTSRYEQVTNISLTLHTMAQAMGITVVALSQVSRSGRDGGLDMSSLRESGQIEQDADVVLLLYLADESKRDGPRWLRVAKNKEGTCPGILLDFDGKRQRFSKAAKGSGSERDKEYRRLPDDTYVPF